ncbi:YgeY family selenium metabolism-linked hydrolase [Bacteroidota bacterium]
MTIREKIKNRAEFLQLDMVNFLREIIAIPSTSGKEKEVVERIKQEMEKLGYDKVWIDPMGNLIGRIGVGNRIIAIDGHCDVVNVGNLDTWKVDPFKGDLKNGVIYGRGASDQKGGLAAAVYAGKILKDMVLPADIAVVVVASVLEETLEGASWQYLINEEKIRPEAVLLTEPTNLAINIGQRGRMEMKIKTDGVSCHGSAPERGENAIYKMASILQDVEKLNNDLKSKSILGKGTVTVTDICSDTPSLCAVSDSCTIHLDRRLSEGETIETSIAEIENLPSVKATAAKVIIPDYKAECYTGLEYPVKAYYPMWLMDENHKLVQKAKVAYTDQFGKETGTGVWVFSTNGVATKGLYDIPSIGFGPGEEIHAHTPTDQVRIKDLLTAVEFYVSFVLHI